MKNIVIINGPNMNLLGEREPEIYGEQSLEELNREIEKYAEEKGVEMKFFQSNHEGEIIDILHKHRKIADGFILNPGAFTHYSYAIRDAVAAVSPPVVEVHLSDTKSREEFRKNSVIKPVTVKQYSGEGLRSYLMAIDYLLSA